jgi:hypothetical protein
MSRCINCEYAVMSVKDPRKCKCWKVAEEKRELISAFTENNCDDFKYGIMHNLQARAGWKP